MRRFFPILMFVLLCLCSCTKRELYSHFEYFEGREWHADSAVSFVFEVADTTAHYSMVMDLRHRLDYPFQNIWFFTSLYKDTTLLCADTLDYFLCDQRGRWLGNGFGSLREMPMLYKPNILFASPGTYRLEVRQGMRDTLLTGVNDLGLTISRYVEE